MAMPLLATKLYIPPPRADLVLRPRLVERLEKGLRLGRKLTLISAPAGFGKTTLLSEWVASSKRPVAWVSLDEGDNDPARFWSYVIAALQTVHVDIAAAAMGALHLPQLPPIEPLLADLINEVSAMQGACALVLDDYHLIKAQPVNRTLTFLLEHLPPQVHLVLSSRANPPWPLARIRARGEMTEIRANDLRFTRTEMARFLNDVMGLELSEEDVATLETHTEGWIAGLQMAALSMQGRKDTAAFIKAFSGSHRFILDYLVEEVLDRQPQDIQDFLLRTSILERLTASLCDAVTERHDSQEILARLEQANLFMIPLDDERRWYRYHHLFADLLNNRLQQACADLLPSLNHRASEWYEENGLTTEAVQHALAAGDVERVADLAEINTLTMMDHGELATLAGWLDTLPEDLVRSRPWVCIARAWPLAYAGRVDAVEPLLQQAEQAQKRLGELGRADTKARRITGHIAAIRAYVSGTMGDVSAAAEIARQALSLLPETDSMARGWAAYVLGFMLRMGGSFAAATDAFAQAAAISHVAGDSHISILTLTELATLQVQEGKLHQAAVTYQDALELASDWAKRSGRPLPATGYTKGRLSGVLRQWNDLEGALRQAQEGLELCEKWGQADALLECHIHLARVHQARGDAGKALSFMQQAIQVAKDTSPWFLAYAEAHQAHLWLAQGNITAASRWVQESGISPSDTPSFQHLFRYAVLSRILIARGRASDALGYLERMLKVAQEAGAKGSVIEILALQATALQQQGEVDQALVALERALSLAEPEGYVRVFTDEGAAMAELLQQLVARKGKPPYGLELLSALAEEDETRAVKKALAALVEPLSEREMEVLRLLPTSLSRAEIAQELTVSVNTVRTHIRNIYGKLDVHRRMEAVQRAKELGLL